MSGNKEGVRQVRTAEMPITLHDRTPARRSPSREASSRMRGIRLPDEVKDRVLEEVKRGVRSAHTSGKRTKVVIQLAPRPASPDVDLVKIEAMTRDIVKFVEKQMARESLDVALAEARSRGRKRVAEILSDPKMLSSDAFAKEIGVTREAVRLKMHRHEVLGLSGAKRGFRYPKWQISTDGKPFSELPQLFKRLGGNPWAVYRFLVQRHPELNGETALTMLEQGEGKRVLEVAENASETFS